MSAKHLSYLSEINFASVKERERERERERENEVELEGNKTFK
jgi:hypothetical protein